MLKNDAILESANTFNVDWEYGASTECSCDGRINSKTTQNCICQFACVPLKIQTNRLTFIDREKPFAAYHTTKAIGDASIAFWITYTALNLKTRFHYIEWVHKTDFNKAR